MGQMYYSFVCIQNSRGNKREGRRKAQGRNIQSVNPTHQRTGVPYQPMCSMCKQGSSYAMCFTVIKKLGKIY